MKKYRIALTITCVEDGHPVCTHTVSVETKPTAAQATGSVSDLLRLKRNADQWNEGHLLALKYPFSDNGYAPAHGLTVAQLDDDMPNYL